MTSRRTLGPLHVTRDRGEPTRLLGAIFAADLGWVDDSALCASAGPDAWWPEGGDAVLAKDLCKGCPLLEPCRSYQLAQGSHGDFGGIWGGLSPPTVGRSARSGGRRDDADVQAVVEVEAPPAAPSGRLVPALLEQRRGRLAQPTPEPVVVAVSRLDLGPTCVCSHGIACHDIRKNGTRSACSVSEGARGAACPCKSYEPKEGDE